MTRREYDRTRWDRTQASLLCLTIAVVSGIPGWIALGLIIGGVR